jgi:hypothetical protein
VDFPFEERAAYGRDILCFFVVYDTTGQTRSRWDGTASTLLRIGDSESWGKVKSPTLFEKRRRTSRPCASRISDGGEVTNSRKRSSGLEWETWDCKPHLKHAKV